MQTSNVYICVDLSRQVRQEINLPIFRITVCIMTEHSKRGGILFLLELPDYRSSAYLDLTYSTYSFDFFYLWYIAAIQS